VKASFLQQVPFATTIKLIALGLSNAQPLSFVGNSTRQRLEQDGGTLGRYPKANS